MINEAIYVLYEGVGSVDSIDTAMRLGANHPMGPLELVRPRVMYEFADAGLEALPSGQKILLRMGPDNAVAVKDKLAELRAILTAAPTKH